MWIFITQRWKVKLGPIPGTAWGTSKLCDCSQPSVGRKAQGATGFTYKYPFNGNLMVSAVVVQLVSNWMHTVTLRKQNKKETLHIITRLQHQNYTGLFGHCIFNKCVILLYIVFLFYVLALPYIRMEIRQSS